MLVQPRPASDRLVANWQHVESGAVKMVCAARDLAAHRVEDAMSLLKQRPYTGRSAGHGISTSKSPSPSRQRQLRAFSLIRTRGVNRRLHRLKQARSISRAAPIAMRRGVRLKTGLRSFDPSMMYDQIDRKMRSQTCLNVRAPVELSATDRRPWIRRVCGSAVKPFFDYLKITP